MRSGDFQKQQLRCIISAVPTAKPLGNETVLRNEYILLLMLAFIYLANRFLICCFAEFLLFSQHKPLLFLQREEEQVTRVRCAWLYLKKTDMKSQKSCFVRCSLRRSLRLFWGRVSKSSTTRASSASPAMAIGHSWEGHLPYCTVTWES